MALNLAPFGRWTLRDKAAQRRLVLFGRTMAILMWAPFLGGLIVAGVRPALYSEHRWLLPSLLVAICAAFAVFSVTRPYAFQ